MKLEKLARLVTGYSQPAQLQQQSSSEEQTAQVELQSSEAVKVAQDFGSASAEYNPEIRRKRIEEIKSQVESGTYYRDSKSVAESLLRDLFY